MLLDFVPMEGLCDRLFDSFEKHTLDYRGVVFSCASDLNGNDNGDLTDKKTQHVVDKLKREIQDVSNEGVKRRPFGIVKRVNRKGSDYLVLDCTRDLLYQHMRSDDVRRIKRKLLELKGQLDAHEIPKKAYDDAAHELKLELPAITPFGVYQDGLRNSGHLNPSGFNMLDYDKKENIDAFITRIMETVERQGLKKYIAFVQKSIRDEGVHIMFVNPENLDTVTGQAWLASKLGEPDYDTSCKDGARPMFLSTVDDLVYIDETLLFKFGVKAPTATVDEQMEAAKVLEAKHLKAGKGKRSSQGKIREAEWNADNLPTEYCGVPYATIVEEFVSRVLHGEPAEGNRHNTQLLLMLHMSYICQHNPALLFEITPQWGQTKSDMVSLAKWVSEIAHDNISPALKGIVCELRAVQAVTVKNADGTLTVLPNAMQAAREAAAEADEEWQEERFYETMKSALIDELAEIVPQLPPALRCILEPVEKEMQMPVLLSVLPILATAADGVKVKSVNGGTMNMSFMTVIQGPPASNKDFCTKAMEMVAHKFRVDDDRNLKIFNEQMAEWQKKKDKNENNRPRRKRRVMGIDFNDASYMDIAEDNSEHSLVAYAPEADIMTKSNKAGAYADSMPLLRLGYDWDRLERERFSKEAKSGSVFVKLNVILLGTRNQVDAFFKDHVVDGTASRFHPYTLKPNNVFDHHVPQVPNWTDEHRKIVDEGIAALCAADGIAETPRAFKALKEWQDGVKDFAKSLNEDVELATCSFRAVPDALKVAAIAKHLSEDKEETDATVNLALIAVKIQWLEQYHRFGAEMRKDRLAMPQQSKREKRLYVNDVVLAMMPSQFTIEQFAEVKKKQTGKDVQIKSVRSKLSQMVSRRGDLELIDENTYRKIPSA